MSIPKFTKLVTTAVPLPIENVDTDQIIPARFLKAVERKGFGDNLFRDWRYDKAGKPVAGFPLNDSRFGGEKLRLRFLARACRMGHFRLWFQGGRVEFLCRYFPE